MIPARRMTIGIRHFVNYANKNIYNLLTIPPRILVDDSWFTGGKTILQTFNYLCSRPENDFIASSEWGFISIVHVDGSSQLLPARSKLGLVPETHNPAAPQFSCNSRLKLSQANWWLQTKFRPYFFSLCVK